MQTTDREPGAGAVAAVITYVAPGSFINRRFVAPGVERNTGSYETHQVVIQDARSIQQSLNLDTNGFVLSRHRSTVTDFYDKEQVNRVYPGEEIEAVKYLTGAQ